jgi:broad specificity phosphatase PhoE
MKIYFARHGESQANLLRIISNRDLPYGLTARGREQAERLAERFQEHSITRIYTSPLLRAIQTATMLADHLGVEWETADGLREFDCGVAEGRADEGAWQLWQAEYEAWVFNHDYGYQIEGGESFQDVQRRFVPFVNGLIQSYAGTRDEVICISHGGIYSVMLPCILQNVTAEFMMKHGFDYTSCIVAQLRQEALVCTEWDGAPV